jgi:putative endonuclease
VPFPLLFHRLLTFGRRSEIHGLDHLRSLGFRIVTSGFHTKSGEIDIIAWEGDVLVFVEVKARHSAEPPEDAVGFRKRRRIIRAAKSYLARHHLREVPYRFDILAITERQDNKREYRLLRDAFV